MILTVFFVFSCLLVGGYFFSFGSSLFLIVVFCVLLFCVLCFVELLHWTPVSCLLSGLLSQLQPYWKHQVGIRFDLFRF